MTKRSALPPIPHDVPRSLRPLLESIRENMQVQLDQGRGNPLDAAVTFRDLTRIDGLTVEMRNRRFSGSVSANQQATTISGSGEVTAATPEAVNGASFSGNYTGTTIQWTPPSYAGHGLTQIFRASWDGESARPVVGNAVLIGLAAGNHYTDTTVTPGESYLYWLQHINIEAVTGPWHDALGTFVQVNLSPEQVMQAATDWVQSSSLTQELLARIQTGEQGYSIASGIDLTAIDQAVLDAQGYATQALTSKTESADSASDAAAYSASAEGFAASALSAKTSTETSESNALSYSEAAEGHATAAQTAKSAAEGYKTDAYNYQLAAEGYATSASGSATEAEGYKTSAYQYMTSAQGYAQTAESVSLEIDGFEERLGGVEAKMTTEYDHDLAAIKSKWVVKADANGVFGSVGLMADESSDTSQFIIAADKFAFISPDETDPSKATPFLAIDAETGKTAISSAYIPKLTAENIDTTNLSASSLNVPLGGSANLPAGCVSPTQLEASFLSSIVRLDPSAEESGGVSEAQTPIDNSTQLINLDSFMSGGSPVRLTVSLPSEETSGRVWIATKFDHSGDDGNDFGHYAAYRLDDPYSHESGAITAQYYGSKTYQDASRPARPTITIRLLRDGAPLIDPATGLEVSSTYEAIPRPVNFLEHFPHGGWDIEIAPHDPHIYDYGTYTGPLVAWEWHVQPFVLEFEDLGAVSGTEHVYSAEITCANFTGVVGGFNIRAYEQPGTTGGIMAATKWELIEGVSFTPEQVPYGNKSTAAMQFTSGSTQQVDRSAFVDFSSAMTDKPSGESGWLWGIHTEHGNENGYGMTLVRGQSTGKLYYRTKDANSYGSWHSLVTSAGGSWDGVHTWNGFNKFKNANGIEVESQYPLIRMNETDGMKWDIRVDGSKWTIRNGELNSTRLYVSDTTVSSSGGARLKDNNNGVLHEGGGTWAGNHRFTAQRFIVGDGSNTPASTIVSDLEHYIELAGTGTSYPEKLGLVFHHEGVSTSALTVENTDVNTSMFNFTTDDANGVRVGLAGKVAFRGLDSWLRINDLNAFSSGIYCGTGILRTDGYFQVGGNGSAAQISSSGARFSVPTEVTSDLSLKGNLLLTGDATTSNQSRTIEFTGFDKEGTTDYSDKAYIRHTTNVGGHTGSVLEIASQNDANDGIAFTTHYNSHLRHNGNVIWTAGNDGSGSGLDADMLDGLHSTNFTRNFGTVAVRGVNADNATCTTAQFISWLTALGAFNYPSAVMKCSWSYAGNNDISDTGWGNLEMAGCVIETFADGAYKTVRVTSPNTGGNAGGVMIYNDQGSGYAPGWRKVWTSRTDGAGSGLDADMLDGYHASSFSLTTHGHTGLSSNSWGGIRSQTAYGYIDFGPANTSHAHIYTDRPDFYFNKELLVNGGKVWHSGNDGAGSGLDADSVDGIQENRLFRSNRGYLDATSNENALNGTLDIGSYRVGRSGYSEHLLHFPDASGSTPSVQLLFNYNDEMYFRCGRDSETQFDGVGSKGNRVWHSSNSNKTDVPWSASNLTVTNHIKFGPGVPGSDDAHIEWLGASNGGYLRFSVSDDATEYMQFGDYDNTNRGGVFTQWAKLSRGYFEFNGRLNAERIETGFNHGVNNSIGCSNWFRSSGATGWYNSSYGGGIYMTDSTWVRVYNNKRFFVDNAAYDAIMASGGFRGNSLTCYSGQQLVLNAGESYSYATGQTDEHVYVNAEGGLQINSSPDNWSSGWAGRYTATICDSQGRSYFPGELQAKSWANGALSNVMTWADFTPDTPPPALKGAISTPWLSAGAVQANLLASRYANFQEVTIGYSDNLVALPYPVKHVNDGNGNIVTQGTVDTTHLFGTNFISGVVLRDLYGWSAPRRSRYAYQQASSSAYLSDWFAVREGEEFYVEIEWYRKENAVGNLLLGLYLTNDANSSATNRKATIAVHSSTANNTDISGIGNGATVVVPAGFTRAKVMVQQESWDSSGSQRWLYHGVHVSRKTTGKLIVDGSIEGKHLNISETSTAGNETTTFELKPQADEPIKLEKTTSSGTKTLFSVNKAGDARFGGTLSPNTVTIASITPEARKEINPFYSLGNRSFDSLENYYIETNSPYIWAESYDGTLTISVDVDFHEWTGSGSVGSSVWLDLSVVTDEGGYLKTYTMQGTIGSNRIVSMQVRDEFTKPFMTIGYNHGVRLMITGYHSYLETVGITVNNFSVESSDRVPMETEEVVTPLYSSSTGITSGTINLGSSVDVRDYDTLRVYLTADGNDYLYSHETPSSCWVTSGAGGNGAVDLCTTGTFNIATNHGHYWMIYPSSNGYSFTNKTQNCRILRIDGIKRRVKYPEE